MIHDNIQCLVDTPTHMIESNKWLMGDWLVGHDWRENICWSGSFPFKRGTYTTSVIDLLELEISKPLILEATCLIVIDLVNHKNSLRTCE